MTTKAKHGTGIEWTHADGFKGETWNPVTGCSKVSPGCANCYAEQVHKNRMDNRCGYPPFKPWTPENAEHNVTLRPDRLDQPLRWTKPRMVFVNSMSDLFHDNVTDEFIADVLNVIARCPQHIFQVLTKRPERMQDFMFEWAAEDQSVGMFGGVPDNLWLGVSIENRHYVDRADLLRQTPAAVRFISAEPLLGPLVPTDRELSDDFICEHGKDYCDRPGRNRWLVGDKRGIAWFCDRHRPGLDLTDIDWLIAGGESGPNHRPMQLDWVRDLRDACVEQREPVFTTSDEPDAYIDVGSGTRFFFKQWGGITPGAGGRELDGRTWDEMPGESKR